MSKELAVNSNSLPRVYTGNPKAKIAVEFMIVDPSGDSDELRYNSWYDAVYALLDCQGIGDKLIKEMNADGVFMSDEFTTGSFNAHSVSDWLHENAAQILNENGWRILEVLK